MSDFKEIILNQKCALNQAEKPSFKAHFSAFKAIFVYGIGHHITVQIHSVSSAIYLCIPGPISFVWPAADSAGAVSV